MIGFLFRFFALFHAPWLLGVHLVFWLLTYFALVTNYSLVSYIGFFFSFYFFVPSPFKH